MLEPYDGKLFPILFNGILILRRRSGRKACDLSDVKNYNSSQGIIWKR